MLVIISPAKKMDFSDYDQKVQHTDIKFKEELRVLLSIMQKKSISDLADLMSLSKSLSELNYDRYQKFDEQPSKPALMAFKGDVYSKMSVDSYSNQDISFAQKHLRILSGLYGILRPLDLIHAYRLEMGTKLDTKAGNNLYDFWRDKLTAEVSDIMKSDDNTLINLASTEYSSAIDMKKLTGSVININFKNFNRGEYRTIGLLAKRARGMMADYIIKNKITSVKDLKQFSEGGYKFQSEHSSNKEFCFFSK